MESKDRTTLCLSILTEDKEFLKIYAAQHKKTVATVIHEAIEQLKEVELNGPKIEETL